MAQIIKKRWGRIWSKRSYQGSSTRAQQIEDYLAFYEKSFPSDPEFAPTIPSVADIQDGLKSTNDSAHGVDGIPFSVYRCLSDITAPLLREMLVFISEGKLPPSDFNCGRLFILPKDGSSVVDRTRPITVNNAENRIIAKITVNQISPGLNQMLDPSQCGFIPGRNGTTHILSLNTFFYDAIKNTNPAYILLLDTAKAFDSIDHDYLFRLLAKINLPPWVLNTIRSLFHDVSVFPALSSPTSVSIQIDRGVKQGCPLSPILFAIAYDPLLVALTNATCVPKAFADDLGMPAEEITKIITALPIIDEFSEVSGLGVNREKTCILTAQKITTEDRAALASAAETWRNVKFVYSAIYLGILMGRNIDNLDIYDKAYRKFVRRVNAYKPNIAHLSIQQKIITANVFLTPIFSYLIQFFLIPNSILLSVNNLLRKLLIGFNGGAFGYAHLTTPTTYFGFQQPLRDLWATMTSRLASLSDSLLDHDGEYIAFIPEKRYLEEPNWASSHITDHRDAAALEYLNYYRSRPVAGTFAGLIYTHNLTGPKSSPQATRRAIYNDCVVRGWSKTRWALTSANPPPPSLAAKFRKYSFPASAADQLFTAAERILPSIPSHFRSLQIKFILGGLPTDCKKARHGMTPTQRGGDDNPYPCYYCTTGQDKSVHLFSECPITTDARSRFHKAIGVPVDSSIRTVSLASPAATQIKLANAVLIFNWHIWDLRVRVFDQVKQPRSHEQSVRTITNFALERWAGLTPPEWWPSALPGTHPPPDAISFIPKLLWPNDNGDCLPDAPTPCYSKWLEEYTAPVDSITDLQLSEALPPHVDPKANPYGNSKTRTPAQKLAAKLEAERLLAQCPSDSVVCFCDGSASPNPGPSGTGVVVYLPVQRESPAATKRPSFTVKVPHGYGTNNTGELWGPLIALLVSSSLPKFGLANYSETVYIFSDSKITIDVCMYNYYPTINKIICMALRDVFINTANSTHLAWVAGHASIDENERADKAAKSAMAASTLRRGMSLTPDHIPLLPLLIHHSLITPHSSYRTMYRNSGFVPMTNPTSPFLLPAPPAVRSPSPPSPALTPPTPTRSPSPPHLPPENHLTYDQQRNANYAALLLEHPDVNWRTLWDRATPELPRRRRR